MRKFGVLVPVALVLLGVPTVELLGSAPPRDQLTGDFVSSVDRTVGVLSRPARLDVESLPLEEALRELHRRSGVPLAFSPSLVAGTRLVTCPCSSATVEEAIGTLLRGTGFESVVVADQLVIRSALSPASGPPPEVPNQLLGSGSAPRGVGFELSPVRFELSSPNVRPTRQGTIVGRVVERGSMRPLRGAQVSLSATGTGTLAGADGRYRIADVPAGEIRLQVQMLGYSPEERTVSVASGATVTVDFELGRQALALDEVVVTGTAGRQLRRSQPAQVDVIRAADLVETAPIANMRDLLQSRNPGVSVLGGGGAPGSGQRIRIRGPVSIDLSNQPLVYVDGVRINARLETSSRMEAGDGSGSGNNTGGAVTSRLNDIPPEDIESIEIVKGPAAATLYGADASAGVINIITKRGQRGGFQQTVNLEYNHVDANFTPPDNWARCTQAAINSGALACQGKSLGELVSDNPLLRENTIRSGRLERLSWTGQGGSGDYQYFLSLTRNKELGVLPGEDDERWSGRINFSWQPHNRVSLNAGYGVVYSDNRMIDNGNSLYGLFVNAFLGSPLTLGGPNDGWLALRRPEHIAAIANTVAVTRSIPTLDITFDPYEWMTHRLVLGADFSNSETLKFIPRNNLNLFGGADNVGRVQETRRNVRHITVDYLANLRHRLGDDNQWSMSLALGSQVVGERTDLLFGNGFGLVTNSARALSATADRSAGQWFAEDRSVGYLSQLEIGHLDRMYLQLGLRADQNSSFGEDVPVVYLPKIGMSYVVSETQAFQDRFPAVGTLRLRTAYGTTGRAPRAGSSLRTFGAAPFFGIDDGLEIGMTLENPGNPELKPERGTELEAGFDLELLEGRLVVDMTFFNQTTQDAILAELLSPSMGFTDNPLVNLGKIRNRGLEGRIRGDLIRRQRISWDAQLGFSTLENEVLDLGGIPPTLGSSRFQEGYPLSARFAHTLRGFDLEANRAIMSDTMEFVGTPFPRYEGILSSNLAIGPNLSLYAQLDGKGGYRIFNSMAQFRDVSTPRSLGVVAPETLSPEERLQRFGPFVTESGAPLALGLGRAQYHDERGDHIRFREIALTYTVPLEWAQRMRANRTSVTLSARNLALWTSYRGLDPDIQRFSTQGLEQFDSAEFFMLPPGRRYAVRFSFGF